MRNRAQMVLIGLLAAMLWVALVALMNRQPPTPLNQAAFVLLWGGAMTCTAIPVCLAIQGRGPSRWARHSAALAGLRVNWKRAGRQGVLVGLLAAALMALRFLGMLNTLLGVFLMLAAVMIEMLARTREAD